MAHRSRPLTHGDYTVGWICALPQPAMVAAAAMLDEEHPILLAADPGDTNTYLPGRIGDHNVVIACLPDEMSGKVSAATAAKDMLRSFPAIRVGLTVGVGGGAPYYGAIGTTNPGLDRDDDSEYDSEDEHDDTQDIRLGDVVVSLHSKSSEAVVQYDLGRSCQEQEFIHTGSKLNKPPAIVLSGVGTLQAKLTLKPDRIPQQLKRAISEHDGLVEQFRYPGSGKDRLFRSEYTHLGGKKSCKACCGPDNINLVRRKDRPDTAPRIHYGTIGSADQMMRDALLRDKWRERENILCFEMEAAGLMDSFPCLVIRGICHYADSHENKIWQPYAALTAAVYAKELLSVIPGQGIINLPPILEVLDVVSRTDASVNTMMFKLDRKEDIEILDWVSSVDYGPRQSDCFRKAQAGTGSWFLESVEFKDWIDTKQRSLFCTGIPGAGKTILTSIAINALAKQALDNSDVGVAYVYCNHNKPSEQQPESLLSSLLKQLAERQASLPQAVRYLYDRHRTQRTRPSLDEITNALHKVAGCFSRVYIFVDALDECQPPDECQKRFLVELLNLQERAKISLFATSRPDDAVAGEFRGATSLEIRARTHDVERFVESKMRDGDPEIFDNDIKTAIKSRVVSATDGMFSLAELLLVSILRQPTKGHVKKALELLADGDQGLDKMYDDTMKRIEDQGSETRDLSRRILKWVYFAKRPLSIKELLCALAIQPRSKELDNDFLPPMKLVQSLCFGLVTLDKGRDIVRLAHYTTRKYFQRTQTRWFPDGEATLTSSCITYLSFDTFASGPCPTKKEFDERLRLNVLFDYAARNWGFHARKVIIQGRERLRDNMTRTSGLSPAEVANEAYRSLTHDSQDVQQQTEKENLVEYLILRRQIMRFLTDKHIASSCRQVMVVNKTNNSCFRKGHWVQSSVTGMHLAAEFDLDDIIVAFMKAGHDTNTKSILE